MRVGILASLDPSAGGSYQYTQTVLRALEGWSKNGCEDRFVVLSNDVHQPSSTSPNHLGWETRPLLEGPPLTRRLLNRVFQTLGEGPHREALRWMRRQLVTQEPSPKQDNPPNPDLIQYRPQMRRWLRRCKIDLLLDISFTATGFETQIPYVYAVHDLQHRLQPEFPEVSADGEWERREYHYRNGCRYATLILADSEVGKEDILNFYGAYGVTADRVKVLPFLPASYLELDVAEFKLQTVRSTYQLPDRYLFYPAQFWPHKNHARILQALGLLKHQRGIEIPIALCGSYGGQVRNRTFEELMSLRSELGLENAVHYLGYVPNEDMSALYAGAIALIMPTFFGPTNIPILEAWAHRCPVLTSDIRGIREQVGDAAVLADPRSVESIAEGIHRLWTDEGLRRNLSDLGRRRLDSYTREDFEGRVVQILQEAKERVRSSLS